MPALGQNYIIAGAGITGMTLALALAKFGASVIVLERQNGLQEFGAGLQISPNARNALNDLGLSEALAEVSYEPEALDTYAHGATRPLVSLELGGLMQARFGAPYAVMHRADLANVLYKACRRFANIDIVFGIQSWSVDSQQRGVSVEYQGADAISRTTKARAFIGADGVHSQARQALLGGQEAQFVGRIAWRSLVHIEAMRGLINLDRVSVFFGAGFHLVCYPLPYRRQVNLALFMPGEATDTSLAQPVPTRPGPAVTDILAAAGANWTPWPLHTVETSTWFKGCIGIAGDAAHAMVPFQAQGAAMGIEDASVLAPLLVAAESAEAGFQKYAQARQRRVQRVAALSASNGRIFHMQWPATLARNTVMRLQGPRGHLRRLGWIYDFKVGPPGGKAP